MNDLLVPPSGPFSQEAEEAVLGAVMINPDAYTSIAAFLKPEDFFMLRHAFIWAVFTRLVESLTAIDYMTVCHALKTSGHLEEIGGPAYITQLVNNTPTSVHAEVYGRIVQACAVRRRMLAAADEIKTLARDEDMSLGAVVNESHTRLQLATAQTDDHPIVTMQEAMNGALDILENTDKKARGFPTGYRDIDSLSLIMARENLILVGGRPGMGKTSWMLGCALLMARLGLRPGFFTMEMSTDSISLRALAIETGINTEKLFNPTANPLSTAEYGRVMEAAGRLSELPILFDDTTGSHMTPQLLRSKARRMQSNQGIDVLFVDYLQKMSPEPSKGRGAGNRVQEVSDIARRLKDLARDLRIPICAGVQLSRSLEQRQDKRPILSDLRESGELEQEADVVAFLYRDVVYNPNTEFPSTAEFILAKNRNGTTGTAQFYFEKHCAAFRDGTLQRVEFESVTGKREAV